MINTDKNLVSIIVPYFRNKKYIKKAIESILKQTYQKFEILLIYDDFLKDELWYIKKNFDLQKKIKIIINKKNLGVAKSRNIGLKKSKGGYIAFLDSDDYWEKNKLKKQIKFMKSNSLDFSFTAYNILYNNQIIKKKIPQKILYKNLLKKCDIGLSTVIIRRELLKLGNFPDLKTQEDFALWLRYARNLVKLAGLNKPLTTWRKTENSLSSNKYQKIKDAFKIYSSFEKNNFIVSIFSVIILILNKIKKNLQLYSSLF